VKAVKKNGAGAGAKEPEILPCECGAEEGQLHEWGCRFELCCFCANTESGSCACKYDQLGLRRRENPADFEYLSESVWTDGLTDEQDELWRKRCEERGRLPYVYAPQMCGRCGVLWPDMFIVQDAAWEYYAGPALRSALLCELCFTQLRENLDRHQVRPLWVPSPKDIARYVRAWRARDTETMKRLDPEKFRPGVHRNIRFP
jgi:hypothetical protein